MSPAMIDQQTLSPVMGLVSFSGNGHMQLDSNHPYFEESPILYHESEIGRNGNLPATMLSAWYLVPVTRFNSFLGRNETTYPVRIKIHTNNFGQTISAIL